jgi:DNA-binding NarL/FixJ family response regulator
MIGTRTVMTGNVRLVGTENQAFDVRSDGYPRRDLVAGQLGRRVLGGDVDPVGVLAGYNVTDTLGDLRLPSHTHVLTMPLCCPQSSLAAPNRYRWQLPKRDTTPGTPGFAGRHFRGTLPTDPGSGARWLLKQPTCWKDHLLSMDASTADADAVPLRAVLADDETLLREGLASLLERSGFTVVGQVGNAVELLPLVRNTSPDIVVVDIRMPPTHTTEGLEAARVIREELPDTGILVLSAHVDVEHAMELLASGRGIGYLLKSRVTDVADFIETLQRIAKGASVIDPAVVQELVSGRRRNDPLAVLSPRELEVLELMAEGRSNAGIARRIWVTEGTVEKHVRSILTKLGLAETDDDHRRVRAVITFLDSR